LWYVLARFFSRAAAYECILSTSGNIEYFEQLDALREAYILAPEVFTEELYTATFAKSNSPDNWPTVVNFLKQTSPRHQHCPFAEAACVHVDLNFDGIQLFQTGVKETIPLLARISAISTSSRQVFTFSTKMPAFMFGVYCGKQKPDANDLMTELVEELQADHPALNPLLRVTEESFSTISDSLKRFFHVVPDVDPTHNEVGSQRPLGAPLVGSSATPRLERATADHRTSVAVERFISDALARRDWTGTVGHSAFWGLPKCKQRGSKAATTGIFYSVIDCLSLLRRDEEWELYLEPDPSETKVSPSHR
jgi:hypothetical protein